MFHRFTSIRRRLARGARTPAFAVGAAVIAATACFVAVRGYGSGHAEVDFNRDIRPVLNERCVTCHGGVKRQGGLSLLFRTDALDTTESGRPAIIPGAPGRSELIRRVVHHDPEERMPQDGEPLPAEEVRKLRRWIAQGAPWADHWAYVRPQPAPLPAVSDPAWPRNGIDHFILARLDEESLQPSPQADCTTLLRRLSLDLIGLPPSPEEADAFCADTSAAAYEQAVDRLLASPHFGEHWAALWLDLARYADSQGYEKDNHRSIWLYRDWVIRAFNRDLPFDQFTVEQLAGDLLPDPTRDQLIATAFHRNTMTNDEGGTDDEEFRVAAVIDRVNTTWEVWQGTTMACVQCHGHPYDPFRQADYYRALAFFNNTEDADRTDEQPVLHSFTEETEERGEALLTALRAVEARIEAVARTPELVRARAAWTARLEAHVAAPMRAPTFEEQVLPVDVVRIAGLPEAERDPQQQARLRDYYLAVAPEVAALREERAKLAGQLAELKPVTTPILRELPPEKRRRTRVFERGNWMVQAEAVQPDVPASLPPLPEGAPKDRLGMARWLVSEDNPLTARVTVNRFWAQLFGTGLVETLEDFGTQGLPPSHPALLDYLALQFMQEHGWSVKRLLKQIVTSAAYRQRSTVTPEQLDKDPQNRLLARGPRVRLSAEQVRDQALFVSGLLSAKMFGPSVMPPQPPGLWQNPYSGAQWETSEGEDRYRRGLYTYWRRTVPYPSMVTFDSPSREVCVSRRIRTNTPLQALVTLNDPVYVEAAQALARRMAAEGGTSAEDRLKTGYRLALLRDPAPAQLDVLRGLYEEAARHYRQAPEQAAALAASEAPDTADLAALTVAANVILNLDAFIMKE